MVYSITYRRPPHVDSARASLNGDEKPRSVGGLSVNSQGSASSFGIPDALSFDRIIAGGTCPVSAYVLLNSVVFNPPERLISANLISVTL